MDDVRIEWRRGRDGWWEVKEGRENGNARAGMLASWQEGEGEERGTIERRENESQTVVVSPRRGVRSGEHPGSVGWVVSRLLLFVG